jgi:hypothetical protein
MMPGEATEQKDLAINKEKRDSRAFIPHFMIRVSIFVLYVLLNMHLDWVQRDKLTKLTN